MLLFCSKSKCSFVDRGSDDSGRFVRVRLLRHGCTFVVVSLYAPNRRSDRISFFSSLTPFLDPGVPTLLCGDFNSVINPSLDRFNAVPNSQTDSPDQLLALFNDVSFVDVWRSYHPSQQSFSWLSPDGSRASHIDLIYYWLSAFLVTLCFCLRYCPLSLL